MATKRDLIDKAFGYIGMATYAYDMSADQIQDALTELEQMMAIWAGKGIKIGYFPSTVKLSADAGIPQAAEAAVSKNLALEIAPSFGKVASPDLRKSARKGYNVLLRLAAVPPRAGMDTRMVPAGEGNVAWRGDDLHLPDQDPPTAPDLTEIDLT